MNKLLVINPLDNVAVALDTLSAGYTEKGVTLLSDVPFGHKVLLKDLKAGDKIIKYGYPIGHITEDTPKGSYVHEHNLKTDLSDKLEYTFGGDNSYIPKNSDITINAYKRPGGKIGIRNEIWIIPTVGCVNKTAQALERAGAGINAPGCDGIFAFTHPYGCSQMADDQENTRKILASLINHPNAGGVLVVSLGCENTSFDTLKKYLGDYDKNRVKLLVCQDAEDELEQGKALLKELAEYTSAFRREPVNINSLVVGFKCGGSDAFSGITANPLCGRVNDALTSAGSSTILTEVPEMFGAEHILMARSKNKAVFDKQVGLINGYKEYFTSHNQNCYENPSPGNHEGGITTLEEKSLGCVQKGGSSVVCDVLSYGDSVKESGLNLLNGPGNDIVSTTNLTCAGAHIILFTTGRGTSLGAPVPTVKISSNSALAGKKKNWIDFNAGELLSGKSADDLSAALLEKIISIANGEQTKNEINGYRDIAIFKSGVTM